MYNKRAESEGETPQTETSTCHHKTAMWRYGSGEYVTYQTLSTTRGQFLSKVAFDFLCLNDVITYRKVVNRSMSWLVAASVLVAPASWPSWSA